MGKTSRKPRAVASKRVRVTRRAKRPGLHLQGIKQGAGKSVNRAFGGPLGIPAAATPSTHFDAFHPHHLPLPRAVGAYSVIRTTQVVSFSDTLGLFGPFRFSNTPGAASTLVGVADAWTNVCGVSAVSGAGSIGLASNTRFHSFGAMGSGTTGVAPGWQSCTLVPAAFSVQIMNPQPLQTTTGMTYVGRCRFMPNLINRTETWDSLEAQLISYNNPRLCAAGKLALGGVHVDTMPFNMSALSNFEELALYDNGVGTLNPTYGIDCEGFAPVFIANPNAIALQVLVCCEWRVRFDPTNPAQAAHRQWPVASDSYWGRSMRMLENMGHGAVDIAERIAAAGDTYQMVKSAARRSLPMLTDAAALMG